MIALYCIMRDLLRAHLFQNRKRHTPCTALRASLAATNGPKRYYHAV